ncbi:MAG TPA: DUF488 domain-containing protein [Burkholderiaceae bacterium]|nr:DUF488 domain-containing protein [Burkholderiaceae bacterium]
MPYKTMQDTGPPIIFTIGHSNRPLDEFLDLLRQNAIAHVVDVRTVPRSRHNPQYEQDALRKALLDAGIAYTHHAALGGLRHRRPDSVNTAWRNKSFQGYADYMQTPEFEAGVQEVVALAWTERCALMCAEAVPWRCHRSLIADALLVRQIRVEDIINAGKRSPHKLTPWSAVEGQRVTYPAVTSEA